MSQELETTQDNDALKDSHAERPPDELANLITHGFGFLLSIPASVVLMKFALDQQRQDLKLACGVYCATLILLYGASTLSHLFHDLGWRRLFRTIDQACIFLLIAGSFTPFSVVYLNEGWTAWMGTAMWVLAILGVILVFSVGNMSTLLKITYLALGWLPVICLKQLFSNMPFAVMTWVIAGGIFYSTGTIFLRLGNRFKYFHAIWHTFVIVGSSCHYIAILLLLALK